MYLQSKQVKAFPLGRPRSTSSNDITSRIFYEQNVSNIIRQLIDVPGFIISASDISMPSGTISGNNLIIDIGGYYFDILSGSSIVPFNSDGAVVDGNTVLKDSTVYLYFCIDTTNEEPHEIIGQDSTDNTYQGLVIEVSTLNPDTFNKHTYNLPVYFGNTDSNGIPKADTWMIYANSYMKFNARSLNITGIDGKHWYSQILSFY